MLLRRLAVTVMLVLPLLGCNRGEASGSIPTPTGSPAVDSAAAPATVGSVDPASRVPKAAACMDACIKQGEACTRTATVDGGVAEADAKRCTDQTHKCTMACLDE
jgi:hypothetical protein